MNSKHTEASVENRYHVRIDLSETYPGLDFPEEVLDLGHHDEVNDFTHWYSTPASYPFITFWCDSKMKAVYHMTKFQRAIESN